jgi:hypothetical protein
MSLRAPEATGLFHPDPQNVANRLYRELHTRAGPGGGEYGFDSLDPLLWSETNYLLTGKAHSQAIALASEFLRARAERQISDPVKRAILQRDLWAVFDWADSSDQADRQYRVERLELMAKLAPIIRRLALSPDEIATLPDTYGRAVENHEFAAAYDPANPNQAFLPSALFNPHGPWVCLGAPGHDLAAPLHDLSFTARSVFLVFARLPGGRNATVAYFERLADMKIPLFVSMQPPGFSQPMDVWNPEVPQFPAATEFALVRKMILPDRAGVLRVTPMIESIQIRHYIDVPTVDPTASRDVSLAARFQGPSEVDLSRLLLFSGPHSGLRGVQASDAPFLVFPAMAASFDQVEERRGRMGANSPFVACTGCHLGPGIQSMMSFSFRGDPNEGPLLSPRLGETTPHEEGEKVMKWAQGQQKWKDLVRLWSSEKPN